MLQLNNVTLAHNGQSILRDLSLTLGVGERIGVIGPSGVGKTSILQTVAGLQRVHSGEISNCFSRIGYVFQEPRLLPWLTAQDNVALPLEARGIRRQQALDTANDWLQRLSLAEDKLSCYPSALSGGMAQRVSLARAFALQPDLLLLDEPFSALDPALRHELIQLCDDLLADLNCALIYVCHHPEELHALTQRCLVLETATRHGQIELTTPHHFHTPILRERTS